MVEPRQFEAILQAMGRKGGYAILMHLDETPLRFSALLRATQLSRTILTTRLQNLALLGLLTRTSFPKVPPHVEYSLTDEGRTWVRALTQLRSTLDS